MKHPGRSVKIPLHTSLNGFGGWFEAEDDRPDRDRWDR
jgi:hypothetical protein